MVIFNTLTGKKEAFEHPKEKELHFFVCGPTVYDDAHIGHARTYLAFDMIVRYLRSQGFNVNYLQNITNIDDKIIERAKEEGVTPSVLAEKFEKRYYEDMKALGIESVNKYARATDHIEVIIAQINALLEKKHAYVLEGDGIYFDILTFPDYGKLSHRTAQQAEDSVSRIDESSKKRNKGDFVLWKFEKPGDPSWDSPFGRGRPGWHIEDTSITEHYFGPQYDIHGGALDLKFPHHEAEIAQQEAASGKKPFVKIWMHTGFLLVHGEKMSKSLKNFITIRDFLAASSGDVMRVITLTNHYRSPLDFEWSLADQAMTNLDNLKRLLAKLAVNKGSVGSPAMAASLKDTEQKFTAAMNDDFNVPEAMAALFTLVSEAQPKLHSLSGQDSQLITSFLKNKLNLFGISLELPQIPTNIIELARQRDVMRGGKDFTGADAARKKADEAGFEIEDTPHGPFIWPKTKHLTPNT